MLGPNQLFEPSSFIRSVGQSLKNLAEDMLEADATEREAVTAWPCLPVPINRVPREIIAEIFWNYIHGSRETVWMSSREAPLLLCRVCSSWRTLAQATPELWTNVGILIYEPNLNDENLSIYAHTINTWPERSGTLDLTVTHDG